MIRPVERPVPLRQSVYEALVELVIAGRLSAGQHLVEAGGWVDLRPNQGAFVNVPTDREVDQLLDVRELLEVEPARLAAHAVTPDQLARLRAMCRDGEAAVAAGDTERFVSLNNSFHAALAEVGGNAVLAELSAIVGRRARWYYRLVAPMREHESCAEHQAMVEAIEAGDGDQAAKVARSHVERTRNAYHRPV